MTHPLLALFDAHFNGCTDCKVGLPCPAGLILRKKFEADVQARSGGKVPEKYRKRL
jgi:hypothetical protein